MNTTEQLWQKHSDLTTETMRWYQFEKAVEELEAENEALKAEIESQKPYTELGKFTYKNLKREWKLDDPNTGDEYQVSCCFNWGYWGMIDLLFENIQESEAPIE